MRQRIYLPKPLPLSPVRQLIGNDVQTSSSFLSMSLRFELTRRALGCTSVYPRRRFSSPTLTSFSQLPARSEEGPVTFQLQDMVSKGKIQPDAHQLRAAQELDRVYHDLMTTDPPPLPEVMSPPHSRKAATTSSSSFFGSWFGRATVAVADAATVSLGFQSPQHAIPGVYTYGGVGCGKTFLMDLLYHSIDHGAWADDKQMVHYHKFMLNIHQFMHISRKEQTQKDGKVIAEYDLIGPVVHKILQQGRLLCLDEFQVTEVADAMILKQLFESLWSHGCVLITTSNRPPRDLYKRGLQRDRFLPFIDLLEERCHVVSLMENETDYRMMLSMQDDAIDVAAIEEQDADEKQAQQSTGGIRPKLMYYFGKRYKKELQSMFHDMTKGRPTNPTTLETQGRKVKIPNACKSKSICMFSFEDLCQKALGAADYLVIGQQFSTVFLYGVPQLSINELNWLRRFIVFVDTMYELKVRLLLQTTAGSLEEIFQVEGDKQSYSHDEVFAYDRTLSRLKEMATAKYLLSQWMGDKDIRGLGEVTTKLDFELS